MTRALGRTGRAVAAALASVGLGCAGVPELPGLRATPAWEEPPPPVTEGPVVDEEALHRSEIDNGMAVLVLEDPRVPLVTVGVTARRGAGSEEPERAGLAAFTASLMERGAGERDALELARTVDELGASLSVDAGWDSTTVSVTGLSSDLERLLEVLADVVRRPRLDPAEARRTRAEQLAALERAKDDPRTVVTWHALHTVYAPHRYGYPQLGVPETVRDLDVEDARAFHESVFTPPNSIFHASGDVETAALLESVRARFGDWSGGPPRPPAPPPPAPAPEAQRVVVVDDPTVGQAQILLLHEGIARDDPRRLPAGLVNDVLGGSGFSSRLMSRVRAEEGLTYSVYSAFAMRRRPGPFLVSTFTRVPEVRRTVDLLLEGLHGIVTSPPSADEVAFAKTYSAGSFGLALETSSALARALVDLDVYDLPGDALDTYRSRVRRVSREELATIARDLFHPDRVAIVVLGPADELVPQLEDLGPVEVVQP